MSRRANSQGETRKTNGRYDPLSKSIFAFYTEHMSRAAKKIFYGLFYLLVFVWIGYSLLIRPAITPPPSCTDGLRNQGEQGIDCGGPCPASCDVRELTPLSVTGTVDVFGLSSGRAVLLARVANTNEKYKASQFFYRFLVHDTAGKLHETVSGSDSIGALEQKYIFESNVTTPFSKIGDVTMELYDVSWSRAYAGLVPKVALVSGPVTTVKDNAIVVSGVVENQSSVDASGVTIVAVLHDAYGASVFASQWVISSLPAAASEPFSVFFPSDPQIESQIDPSGTKIFISPRA